MLSSRCRGMTVTSSISHRNATSFGTRPRGNGRAIFAGRAVMLKLDRRWRSDDAKKNAPLLCESRRSGRINLKAILHFNNEAVFEKIFFYQSKARMALYLSV